MVYLSLKFVSAQENYGKEDLGDAVDLLREQITSDLNALLKTYELDETVLRRCVSVTIDLEDSEPSVTSYGIEDFLKEGELDGFPVESKARWKEINPDFLR